MTEEERLAFWGDLARPIIALLGGLAVRGELKLVEVVQAMQEKAENAAKAEREECALICDHAMDMAMNDTMKIAYGNMTDAIRARGKE